MNNAANNLPNVAIVGRPNVGKSALFNRLIGRKIAIVHDQPGITRDRISTICTRGARPFTLWDTGGLSVPQSRDELSTQVRRAAQEALRDSDLLLFVVDAKEGLSPIDEDLARMLRKSQKPVVLVINKIDNEKHEPLAAEFDSLGFEPSLSISAEHGRGITDLLAAIVQRLSSPPHDSRVTSHDSLAIAILGRPNVGKSSLINSIVRSERAIVSELPGTTRDAIDISYERDGRQFVFIDTAGIRPRGKRSVGATAQNKRIAGLIQKARKPAIIVLNKWDLVRPTRGEKQAARQLVQETRARIFFLEYVPMLITSALTGENVEKLFVSIEKVQRAARQHIGTGILNRLLRQAFEANPPPLVKGRRLKLFYAAQTSEKAQPQLQSLEFVLFVNDPRLMNETYCRYLETRIRKAEPYPGLPITLTLRPRTGARHKKQSGRRAGQANKQQAGS